MQILHILNYETDTQLEAIRKSSEVADKLMAFQNRPQVVDELGIFISYSLILEHLQKQGKSDEISHRLQNPTYYKNVCVCPHVIGNLCKKCTGRNYRESDTSSKLSSDSGIQPVNSDYLYCLLRFRLTPSVCRSRSDTVCPVSPDTVQIRSRQRLWLLPPLPYLCRAVFRHR